MQGWPGTGQMRLRQGEQSTQVYNVTRDGKFKQVIGPTGRQIVGAGVSTCAPTGMDMGF